MLKLPSPGLLQVSLSVQDLSFRSGSDIHDYDSFAIPPALPLPPKEVPLPEPTRPAFHTPLLYSLHRQLPSFVGSHPVTPQHPPVSTSMFPTPYPPDCSLRKLFLDNIVYQRTKPSKFTKDCTRTGFFNARVCEIKKLMVGGRKEDSGSVFVDKLESGMKPGLYPAPVFESRFESGNLEMVAQLGEFEYNLLLQNDVNAMGKTQWFFFRVSNASIRTPYIFHILNFCKPDSLFNAGMLITVYSAREYQETGVGWQHAGSNLLYYPNGIAREDAEKKEYFSLSFEYVFKYTNDEVYFAYSYPYTYTQLQQYLYHLETDSYKSRFITKKELCRSLSGNPCDYLTITNSQSPISQKRGVFLSARVHPGETVGSYVMKGVLDFLTSESSVAEMLRNQFVFKIIPMLNPDGVVNGNHRCGVLGVDLNRRWRKPHKTIHPTIFHAKRLVKAFASSFPLDLVCDLHGHSRKSSIFMYGNSLKSDPLTSRLFPYILSKLSPVFHYPYCKFTITKSKEATLRVALHRELQLPCVYTLESSFLGPDTVSDK